MDPARRPRPSRHPVGCSFIAPFEVRFYSIAGHSRRETLVTERTPGSETPDWLLEPPKPNEARIYIYVGSEAELMPEVREALDHLSAVLRGDEVQGYSFGYS